MSTTREPADQQREQRAESPSNTQRQQECGRLERVVAMGVMHDLGRPADFLRAGARLLWKNYYRVNVFVGPNAAARIAYSFLLEVDPNGKILTCKPPVRRAH